MKISPIRIIAISAYLSAMLMSSVPSIRSGATLATPVDPEIAKMMLDLNGGRSVEAANTPTPVAKFVNINHEGNIGAFERLHEFTLGHKSSVRIGAGAVQFLGFPKNDVYTKQTLSTLSDGKCYFSVSLENPNDIFIMVKRNGKPLTIYLTNLSLEWRAAAINTPGNPHSMTKEESIADFNALVEFWVENSKTLPSTTSVDS